MPTLYDAMMQERPKPTATVGQAQVEDVLAAKTGKAQTDDSTPKGSSLAANLAQRQVQTANVQQALDEATQAASFATQDQRIQLGEQQANRQLDTQVETARANQATALETAEIARNARTEAALAGIQGQERRQTAQLAAGAEKELKKLEAQRGMQVTEMFGQFERSNKELEFRKDAAQLEQLGFLLAMQDKAYIDTLDQIGRARQLEDRQRWNEEKNRIILGEQMNSLLDELGFKQTFNANRRAYERALGDLDIRHALSIADAAIAAENRQAMIEGGIDAVKAGADAAVKVSKAKPQETNHEAISSSNQKS